MKQKNKFEMTFNKTFFVLLFLCSFAMQNTQAQNVEDIVNKANKVFKYNGDDRINVVNMDIKNKNGKVVMNRELVLIRKNDASGLGQKWYSYFKKPADIRKMVFMVWKNTKKDDDRWIYLPAMDLVKRLAGSDKRSSFVGSQFVYEDVTGRLPKLDTHELIKTTDDYYEVKSTPKNTSAVEFSYFYTWIDKKTFVPTKRVYYDKNGDKQREYRVDKVEKIQNYDTITAFSMTNIQTGESTYVNYIDIKYNVGIPDNIFTETYLRRVPRKWVSYNKK
ncbi:outer membrane lipoprotein-sorting protein [uncultured Lacinutrix sp.]|uniref:outer membrane lipoprotein-sorting protein n=1 Tax=uncultured Lacinutrix sp. TaxID=574032 RepID=UPI0026186D4F|nr:outer membrane lipoprotein-sorting protein [uncultured Lacinutrix sp.]